MREKKSSGWRRVATMLAVAALVMMAIPMLSVRQAAADNIDVSLLKLVCPSGQDWSSGNLDDLGAGCTEYGVGFPFTLIPDAGGEQAETSTSGSGEAIWSGLPAGTGAIYETAAENNNSRVFCSLYTTGDSPGEYSEWDATGNAIGYALLENESLDCLWFNYPAASGDSVVSISKYHCPEGYDWQAASAGDLSAACGNALEGIQFDLYPGDGGNYTAYTDNNGIIQWDPVAAGALAIVETVPSGEQPVRIFCASAPLAGGGDDSYYEQPIIDGNQIQWNLAADYYLECFWYNAPGDTKGTLEVYKYQCADGYDWSNADFVKLTTDCGKPQKNIEFAVSDQYATVKQATDASGFTTWTGLDAHDYALHEFLPDGYGNPRAYCTSVEVPSQASDWSEYQVSDAAVSLSIESGKRTACYWFNRVAPAAQTVAPAGPASLTINKYTCEGGYVPFEEGADPVQDCDLGTEDINFTLDDGESAAQASTGEGGAPATIQFDQLNAGTYLLQEELPDDIAWAFILTCGSDARSFANYPFAPFATIEPQGRIGVQLLAGENMECDWFNVLEAQGGAVTIIKYWCPGAVVSKNSCELYPDGVSFTLEPVNGDEDISLETGEDGTATVEAEGVFNLIENDFDWCSAESDYVNADGLLVVEPGDEALVEVYNCGPQPGA